MKKKGISLIVLIITIVVIIILAASIILNLSNVNLINNANEAVLKQDMATFKSELELYLADKFVDEKGKYDKVQLYADTNTATYKEEKIEDKNGDGTSNIYDILTSLKNSNWKDNVYIKKGKIVAKKSGLKPRQVEAILEMGIEVDGMPSITSMSLESTETSITVSISVNMQEEVEKYMYILNDGEAEESTELTKTYTELTPGVNYKVEVIMVLKDGTEISKEQMIYTKTQMGTLEYTLSENDWTKDDVTVEITYSEETIPEGYEIQYKLLGSMTQAWTKYTEPVTVTTNNTTVVGRLYNEILDEEYTDGSSSVVSKIDKEAPTTPTSLNLTASSTTITAVASGSTDSLSGNITYKYSIDNVKWQESGEFTGLTLGQKYTVYAKAIDKVGNESETKTSEITTAYADWEKEAPTVTMSMNTSGKVTEGTTITIGGSSNVGIKNATLKLGDQVIYTEQTDNVETYSKTLTLLDLTGLENVLFYSTNTLNLTLTTKANITGEKNISNVQNYTVGSAASLSKLAEVVNGGNTLQGETILQLTDIDLSTVENWTPIGYNSWTVEAKKFNGIYNGNNKSVTSLYINNSEDKTAGLFGLTGSNATVKNLTVRGTVIQNASYGAGGIVGRNEGTIQNCINYANITNTAAGGAGGIAGVNYLPIDKCTNYGTITSNTTSGGIVAHSYSGNITNCTNNGTSTVTGTSMVGGICGYHEGSETSDIIYNCTNKGTVIATKNIAGGIIGNSKVYISYCKNSGSVTANSAPSTNEECGVGGIAGRIGAGEWVLYCSNTGNIHNTGAFAGGIVGWSDGDGETISGCYNKNANVIGDTYAVGGIIGRANDNTTITCCYNYLSSTNYCIKADIGNAGGIVGAFNINKQQNSNDCINVTNCYNIGENISSPDNNQGAIVGAINPNTISKIENCYYLSTSSLNEIGYIGKSPTTKTIYQKTDALFKGAKTSTTSVTYLLNGNSSTGMWSRSSTINGGYPYLVNNK